MKNEYQVFENFHLKFRQRTIQKKKPGPESEPGFCASFARHWMGIDEGLSF